MLADEPELLAFADAFVASTAPVAVRGRATRFRESARRVPARLAVAACVAGAAALLLFLSPWTGGGGLVPRALAAIGTAPVLHVVLAQPGDFGQLYDGSTATPLDTEVRVEIWFDRGRGIKATETTAGRTRLEQSLETPKGSWSSGGPIFTCAWIAAHPAEAAKARVSCAGDGRIGGAPVAATSAPAKLDPALANFADTYASALASGTARETERATVAGRDARWLEIKVDAPGRADAIERVAVDAATYKPFVVEDNAGRTLFRVLSIESTPYDPATFARPVTVDRPSGGSVTEAAAIAPLEAATTLGGKALWLGQATDQFELTAIERNRIAVGYGPLSNRPADIHDGLQLEYALVSSSSAKTKLTVSESAYCNPGWGWLCAGADPDTEGTFLVRGPVVLLRKDGLYVTIWNWLGLSPRNLAEIASQLRPIR
jgi:hypothetical protein